MTMRDLTYRGPITAAIASGATTPDPGVAGVSVWSSTTGSLVTWNGSNWVIVNPNLASPGPIGGTTPSTGAFTVLTVGTHGIEASATLTTSTTSANQVVDASLAIATYRSVEYQIQVTSGSAYQAVRVSMIHNGTDVFMTEYGLLLTGASLASFTADISGGNMRLLTTPVNSVTTYKVRLSAIVV